MTSRFFLATPSQSFASAVSGQNTPYNEPAIASSALHILP